jgi:hypothetical protein
MIALSTHLPKLIALIFLGFLYIVTEEPTLSEKEELELTKDFKFSKTNLFEPFQSRPALIRNVHPQYEGISSWISSVGASVSITDIDNNGISNDVVHVDPRYDKIFVAPAPGTKSEYEAFEIYPKRLIYNKRTTAPMGTLCNDFNEDGAMDILVYYWGRPPIIFYRGINGFTEVELSDPNERWFTNAATVADFDGNGHPDIVVSNYFPDGGRVLDAEATDFDQTMQHSMSRAYNGGSDHFFLSVGISNGQTIFKEDKKWSLNIENPRDWTLAVAAADLNGDLLPEIYFANDFGPDKLLLNQSKPGKLKFKLLKGERRMSDIRSSVLGRDSFKGMGVDFGDINNDGNLDIYVSNIADEFALHESHFAFINTGEINRMVDGYAPFVNNSESLGLSRSSWGWDSKLADFNNDGVMEALQATGFIKGKTNKWAELQELAMGNDELLANPKAWPDFRQGTDLSGHRHNPFFIKSKSGRYYDMAKRLKIDQHHVSRGIAVGDVDHDGDLDFALANQWEPSIFFTNNYTGNNSFLGVRLLHSIAKSVKTVVDPEKPIPSRFAIGSLARVKNSNDRTLIDFVDGGNGHSGKNSSEIFFGLGTLSPGELLTLEVSWRNSLGRLETKEFKLTAGWHNIYLAF